MSWPGATGGSPAPAPPAYGRASLAELLPSIWACLSAARAAPGAAAPGAAAPGPIPLPPAGRVCLLLVDGLGLDLLADAGAASAPFLHELLPGARILDAGFPSSTPVSLASLATGRPPGEHGLVGFTMHVPPVDAVVECLAWTRYGSREDLSGRLPPETLQPIDPLMADPTDDRRRLTVVSLAEHEGSGLTRAVFRGARYVAIARFDQPEDRLAKVRAALSADEPALAYTYDGRLDAAAHESGTASGRWRTALRLVDELARGLADALPAGTLLLVTGDHGAVDVAASQRVDLADRPELAAAVGWLSGDPRTRHVHLAPGGRPTDAARRWREALGPGWHVLTRDEAIDAGLFGARVRAAVRPRIGDLVVTAAGRGGLFDTRRYPWEQRLAGFHGGLASAEQRVPLLSLGP